MFRKYVRFLLDKHLFVLYINIKNRTNVWKTVLFVSGKIWGNINMTVQERKRRNEMKRRKQVAKQKMVLLLATVFVITIGSVVFGSIFSSAKNPDEDIQRYKYYKSIVIEQGDSLWSIAQEYKSNDVTTKEYVEELKELNALKSENIREGQHLMVAYYDTELR